MKYCRTLYTLDRSETCACTKYKFILFEINIVKMITKKKTPIRHIINDMSLCSNYNKLNYQHKYVNSIYYTKV